MCSDKYDVHECHFIDDDCVYVTYKATHGFEEPLPNTNAVIASYVTAHARVELYSYRENLGDCVLYCEQVLKCKGFTLNKLTSDKITFNVMKDLATGNGDSSVSVDDSQKIRRDVKRRRIFTTKETKTYRRTFDRRIMREDYTSIPYGCQ